MMRPTPVSAAVDTRLIHVLARMALQVLETVSAASASAALGFSERQTPVSSIHVSY
ncbi:MAG TPA: hypothetical protein VLK82_18845 [Candidatus Tectomicrobia bacterium]|nr:hypothetical protein [Candidatus Tectomicrobia bacterium]